MKETVFPYRALLAVLMAAVLSHAAPARLDGADRLLEQPATAAALNPAALARADSRALSAWVGLAGSGSLLNDDLGLDDWNRHAGSRLDVGDRLDLLEHFGNSLAFHGRMRVQPLAVAWRPAEPFLESAWVLGAGWELETIGRAGMDARVLRTLFLGNTPGEAVVIRNADVRALHLSRWRLQAAVSDPGGMFPGWAVGAGLGFQQGAMARSTLFQARLEPPHGTLAGHFEHRLASARRGRGWFLDLGAAWHGMWITTPVRVDLALRGAVNRMRWSGMRERGQALSIEPTPLSSRFELDTWEDALVDSTWNRSRPRWRDTLPPTLDLGLVTHPHPEWDLALLGEFTPAGGPHPGQRRVSVVGRHRPSAVRGLSLGGELAAGQGRGPGLGLDLGWHSRRTNLPGGPAFVCGLALTNRAGILHKSRGFGVGLTGGLEF